jgi:hypothetical protein
MCALSFFLHEQQAQEPPSSVNAAWKLQHVMQTSGLLLHMERSMSDKQYACQQA